MSEHSEKVANEALMAMAADAIEARDAEIERLRAEIERERLRLAACGVVALCDTLESAAKAHDIHEEYKSASCDDVARVVNECMRLRVKLAVAKALLRESVQDAFDTSYMCHPEGGDLLGRIHALLGEKS